MDQDISLDDYDMITDVTSQFDVLSLSDRTFSDAESLGGETVPTCREEVLEVPPPVKPRATEKPPAEADLHAQAPAPDLPKPAAFRPALQKTPPPQLRSDEWCVERVLKRKNFDGEVHYLVKWHGTDKTTWEPESTLEIEYYDKIVKYHDARSKQKPSKVPLLNLLQDAPGVISTAVGMQGYSVIEMTNVVPVGTAIHSRKGKMPELLYAKELIWRGDIMVVLTRVPEIVHGTVAVCVLREPSKEADVVVPVSKVILCFVATVMEGDYEGRVILRREPAENALPLSAVVPYRTH